MDDKIRISLSKDLSQKEYLKLVGFLESDEAKDYNKNLLRIVKAEVDGNPPIYRGVVIGLYRRDSMLDKKEARERVEKVLKNLVDVLYELEAF